MNSGNFYPNIYIFTYQCKPERKGPKGFHESMNKAIRLKIALLHVFLNAVGIIYHFKGKMTMAS